jgi:hypothetical protein
MMTIIYQMIPSVPDCDEGSGHVDTGIDSGPGCGDGDDDGSGGSGGGGNDVNDTCSEPHFRIDVSHVNGSVSSFAANDKSRHAPDSSTVLPCISRVSGAAAGSAEEWVQSAFGPSGFAWPEHKRAALSTALEEEEFYSAASIAEMDNDIAAEVVKAACLRAGTAQDFTNARMDLQTGSGGSGPPVHLDDNVNNAVQESVIPPVDVEDVCNLPSMRLHAEFMQRTDETIADMFHRWKTHVHLRLKLWPKNVQCETVLLFAKGIHTFLFMPTGYGKSLVYIMMALLSSRKTIIVVEPLISIVQDQDGAQVRRKGVGH